jgi:glycosyltransferase involved in cell wall biosynthesis
MHLGMPVVALATTEAMEAVPPGTGYCSTDVDRLVRQLRDLVAEPELARELGMEARAHALHRYGLDRFLRDWDGVLADVTDGSGHRSPATWPLAAATIGRS